MKKHVLYDMHAFTLQNQLLFIFSVIRLKTLLRKNCCNWKSQTYSRYPSSLIWLLPSPEYYPILLPSPEYYPILLPSPGYYPFPFRIFCYGLTWSNYSLMSCVNYSLMSCVNYSLMCCVYWKWHNRSWLMRMVSRWKFYWLLFWSQ